MTENTENAQKTADEFQSEMDKLQQRIDELVEELENERAGHAQTAKEHEGYVKEAEKHTEQLARQIDELREDEAKAQQAMDKLREDLAEQQLTFLAEQEARRAEERRVSLTWDDQPLNDGPAFAGAELDIPVNTAFMRIPAESAPSFVYEGTMRRVEPEESVKGVWEIQTLLQPMCLTDMDENDAELADFLNEGWEILNITVLPATVITDGVAQPALRVITLERLNEDDEPGDKGEERAPAPFLGDDEDEDPQASTEALLTTEYVLDHVGFPPAFEDEDFELPEPNPYEAIRGEMPEDPVWSFNDAV